MPAWIRWVRRLLVLAVVFVVAFSVVTWRLFLAPPNANPTHADAVVVLSGDHGERIAVARRMLTEGVTDTLVYAGQLDGAGAEALCHDPQEFTAICLAPDPDNTREEARAVGRLSAEKKWTSIIVVTSTQHNTRAGLLFRRCVEAHVTSVHAVPPLTRKERIKNVVAEWQKVIYSFALARSC
jgi:uncharacterized SAM-binding protein YcdF (DUF218 family)